MNCKKLSILIILLSTFLINNIFSQEKSDDVYLPTVKRILNYKKYDRTTWSLYKRHPTNENYFPKSAKYVIQDIDKFLSNTPKKNKTNGQINEYTLIKEYQNDLKSFFDELDYINDISGSFFYSKKGLPLHFSLFKDKYITLIITNVYVEHTYNTLDLTSKQRATKVITSYVLPSLHKFTKHFSDNKIKYFGISCTYGSKDFSTDDELNIKPEFVGFIVPAETLKKYVELGLTEEALVNSAEIFLSDRNMITELKKIQITID